MTYELAKRYALRLAAAQQQAQFAGDSGNVVSHPTAHGGSVPMDTYRRTLAELESERHKTRHLTDLHRQIQADLTQLQHQHAQALETSLPASPPPASPTVQPPTVPSDLAQGLTHRPPSASAAQRAQRAASRPASPSADLDFLKTLRQREQQRQNGGSPQQGVAPRKRERPAIRPPSAPRSTAPRPVAPPPPSHPVAHPAHTPPVSRSGPMSYQPPIVASDDQMREFEEMLSQFPSPSGRNDLGDLAGYGSLYEKVRDRQSDSGTPLWLWLLAALALLVGSFGGGFLLMQVFVGGQSTNPPAQVTSP